MIDLDAINPKSAATVRGGHRTGLRRRGVAIALTLFATVGHAQSPRVRRLPPVRPAATSPVEVTRSTPIVSAPEFESPRTPTATSFRPRRPMTRSGVSQPTWTSQTLKSVIPGGGHASVRMRDGRKHRVIAYQDLDRGALASAESLAWLSIEAFADAADARRGESAMPSTKGLQTYRHDVALARTAIEESDDFSPAMSASGSMMDLRRRSHRSVVVPPEGPVEAAVWADLYLDHARGHLVGLAAVSIDAAESMDLLAAVLATRDQTGSLAMAKSLCLRRAALAGQPGNVNLANVLADQLATAGLRKEAFGVRHYAQQLAKRRTGKRPLASRHSEHARDQPATPGVLLQPLSPERFASISGDVIGGVSSQSGSIQTVSHRPAGPDAAPIGPSSVALTGGEVQPPSVEDARPVTVQTPSMLRRLTRRLTGPIAGDR